MTDLLSPTKSPVLPQLRDWLSRPRQLFIGGEWVDAVSGRTFETRDPATGQVLTEVAYGDAADVDQGLRDGARALTGGRRHGNEGYFVEPTVLVDVDSSFSAYREEIFGPVVVATPFSAECGVAQAANDTPYGLAASVWTTDVTKAHRTARQIKAGTVWINCHNAFDTALPFGGYKASDWGRELGATAIDAYTEQKSVNALLA
jgi:acyl-CoA reductase-like NAD-dependent aldehyde dehydrogenase